MQSAIKQQLELRSGWPQKAWRCQQPRSSKVVHLRASVNPQPAAQEIVKGACCEEVVDSLARRALKAAEQLPEGRAVHIVGIAGSPGSGKSTLARLVAQQINSITGKTGQERGAAVAPMDGFHLYKAQLDQMPDPQEAYARRGAPWTFDAPAFVQAVKQIKQQGRASLPSFDHGRGDPVEDDIIIDAQQHLVVLVEGNYLFLEDSPWCELLELFDDTWFCDIDLDSAMKRVFERQTALGVTPEQSRVRVSNNDRPNGVAVNASKHRAKVLVPSDIPLRP